MHETIFLWIHQLFAALVDHTRKIRDPNVFFGQAQIQQQIQAGKRCRAGARDNQLDLFYVFAHNGQAIDQCRANHDGSPMLIIMKDRDLHPLAQLALDIKTIRRLDVFQIHTTEGRLKGGNNIDQTIQVGLVDLEIKDIDASELLKENALSFHDRLGRQWANIAQAQHRSAVGDHSHQIAARCVAECIGGIFDNFFAGRRHAGRIRQCKIALIDQLLGGRDRDFSWTTALVIFECLLPELRIHGLPRTDFYKAKLSHAAAKTLRNCMRNHLCNVFCAAAGAITNLMPT